MNEKNNSFKIKPFIGLVSVVLFTCFVLNTCSNSLRRPWYYATVTVAAIAIILLRKSLKFTDTSVIIGSGIFLRWLYILYTEVWQRQHDVVAFGAGEGQAAYIEYFLTHRSFPDFDPRSIWGFFQPPLHHIISSIWMKISLVLGYSEVQSQENIQGLTFFYMGAVLLITYFICKELELKKWGTRVALAIVSFHPIYILLSGSINNDALSLLFMVLALYLAICWYKREKMIAMILLALSIGLAMFAKLSGYMIAPAVAALFILKLIENKDRIWHFILQYVIFGIICVPVGLFWTVRNMLKFNMPINYIPEVGGQFRVQFYQRLFDFSMESVFPALMENGDSYYEYNIFLSMLKTSIFGEYNYANESRFFTPVCTVLFIVTIILAITAFVATIILILSAKSHLKREWRWLFGVLYLTVMGSYLGFALSYSNFSAEDFRYAAIVIIVEAVMLGLFTDGKVTDEDASIKDLNLVSVIIIGATALFGVCSFITYVLLGFVQ